MTAPLRIVIREGVTVLLFTTAIGTCGVEWDATGITRVHLPRDRALARAQATAGARDGVPAPVAAAAEAMTRLLQGEPEPLADVAVSDAATEPFARRVYAATREVGPGETTTYGAIAWELGDPSAARAVGAALGANPTPIVVPCHRVLAADGSLHGFSAPGGIATKRRMLEIEGAPGFAQATLFAC
jgi:methylated-DNA-[protein]-cysteine S-methyltransferase